MTDILRELNDPRHSGHLNGPAAAEIKRLRGGEWSYDSLVRILGDELPLTMSLGLLQVLVRRMVKEKLFAEPIEGLVAAVRQIATRAAEAEKK